MTDRINAFIVVLDTNIRDDDVQPILDAIKMIRHVVDVVPSTADTSDIVATSRVKSEVVQKLFDLINEISGLKPKP